MTSLVDLEHVSKVDLKLPTLPGIAIELMQIFQNNSPDLKKAARIISADAPLSAKVLRSVNSPLYGLANRISSINQAMALLGTKAVKSLALSFSLMAGFQPKKGSAFSYSQFWKDSLVGAIASRAIVTKLKMDFPDDAFFCGLLQNIGSLILSESFPQKYARVAEECRHASVDVRHAESAIIGRDHTEIGEYAIRKWGFPDFFVAPIRFHHQPDLLENASSKAHSLTQILYLASLFIDAFNSGAPRPQFAAIGRYLDRCGYAEVIETDEIIRQISSEANSIFPIFDIQIDEGKHIRIIESAKQELAEVSENLIVQVKKQANAIEHLKQQSSTDGLTKLYNQKHFIRTLKHEIERANRHSTPLSMVMADIDDFKSINDFHGHLTGDFVLKIIASRLKDALRGSDYLARYGGEEFAAILPLTSLHEASHVTERLRQTVRAKPILYKGKSLLVTMSFGIATLSLDQQIELESFIHMADEALYEAKNSGRDKCCIYRRATPARTRSTVLVVDDEEVVLETLCKMLERLGFGVIAARDGTEALTLFGQHENAIDTVILDVMIPGTSSPEVFNTIKAAPGDVRVFLSSGYTVDLIEKSLLTQCDGFLAKPFTIDDLSVKLCVSVPGNRTGFRHTPSATPFPTA